MLVYRLDDRLFCERELRPGRIHAPKGLISPLPDKGIALVVARLKGPMQRTFRDVGLLDVIGEGHVYPTVRAAVRAACSERGKA